MVEYQAQNGGLGLNEMIDALLNATWKAERKKGMEALIQMQTEQVLLTYLLAASIDDDNSFIAKSVISKTMVGLKTFIETKKKTAVDITYSGHLLLALDRMTSPDKAKPTIHVVIPPGSPIGCGEE